MICDFFALGPIIPRDLISLSSGKTPSFFSKTIPSFAAFRSRVLWAGLSFIFSGLILGLSNLFEKAITFKILETLSSIISCSTAPEFIALSKLSPQVFAGPGISRSSPPIAFSLVSNAAPQSLTT